MNDDIVRRELVKLLDSGHAHATLKDTLSGFSTEMRGIRPPGSPHSAWELLEHLGIAGKDIVDYTVGTNYKPLKFPDDYWPATAEPPDAKAWDRCLEAFASDLHTMRKLIENPSQDIFAPLPHAPDATIYGQTLLLADHNAYHIGQLMLLRRILEGATS
jgi:hypothetical protein